MGLVDYIRSLFSSSKNNRTEQPKINEEYEKSKLADKIVDLVSKIKSINYYDSSIWNFSNLSSYDLKKKSLNELQMTCSSLENRLFELEKQEKSRKKEREALEEAKWTGKKPQHMSDHEFDRFQRDD